jgi:hypothetical protein
VDDSAEQIAKNPDPVHRLCSLVESRLPLTVESDGSQDDCAPLTKSSKGETRPRQRFLLEEFSPRRQRK